MNPYEILGVSRDTDEKEIKAKYKKLAKSNHPDAGGEGDKMAEISRAYAVLINPEKRAHFDATGQTVKPSVQQSAQARFTVLVVELILSQPERNIGETVKRHRQNMEAQLKDAQGKIKQERDKLETLRKRILTAPELDLMGGVIEQRLAELKRTEAKFEFDTEVENLALEMFDGYKFTEPKEHPQSNYYVIGNVSFSR